LIVFEIFLNGRQVARAGAKNLGVLSTHVNGVGKLGPMAKGRGPKDRDLYLSVGGLTTPKRAPNTHLNWLSVHHLKLGDEVRVRITEAARADKPRSSKRANPKPPPVPERQRFEFARELYLKLRPKYERRGLTARLTRTRARAARAGQRER
jgi:hypothetical protein